MTDLEDLEPARIGERIANRYDVLSRLGAGGMGIVYLAHDSETGRKVVLKFPMKHLVFVEGFRGRFQRERQQLIAFEHSSVVRVYGAGEHGGMPFMVLAYLSGGSLADRLAASGPQSVVEVRAWLPRIAAALDSLHRQGIIHRDVKAANILFDAHDDAYLSDFGIVKILSELEQTGTMTGGTLGSPESLAPEFVDGVYTPAYDQYGLATAVYQALAGRLPFEGTTGFRLHEKLVREAPSSLADVAPQVGAGASAAVDRALAKVPAQRFGSCREFAQAFGDAASPSSAPRADEFTAARAAAPAVRARQPAVAAESVARPRRVRRLPILIALALLPLLVLAAWLLVREPKRAVEPVDTALPATGANVAAVESPRPRAALTGPEVYEQSCVACHGVGIAGAPRFGDVAAWSERLAQPTELLYEHALEGFSGKTGLMPAKGGRADLSDDEVRAAVDYMVSAVRAAALPTSAVPAPEKSLPETEKPARKPVRSLSPEERDWKAAQDAATPRAVDEFLKAHPDSRHQDEARAWRERLVAAAAAAAAEPLIGSWRRSWDCPPRQEGLRNSVGVWRLDIEKQNAPLPKVFWSFESVYSGRTVPDVARCPLDVRYLDSSGVILISGIRNGEMVCASERGSRRYFDATIRHVPMNDELQLVRVNANPGPCVTSLQSQDERMVRQ